MVVGIAGLGLIGGSLAKAYERSGATVYGYDGNRVVQDFAKLQGVLATWTRTPSESVSCCWWPCTPR